MQKLKDWHWARPRCNQRMHRMESRKTHDRCYRETEKHITLGALKFTNWYTDGPTFRHANAICLRTMLLAPASAKTWKTAPSRHQAAANKSGVAPFDAAELTSIPAPMQNLIPAIFPAPVWRYWRRWGCHWWIQIRRRNSIRSGSRYFQDVGAVTRQVTKQPLKEEIRNPIVSFSFYWIIINFVWPIYGSTAEHIILFVPAKTMIK